MGINVGAAIGPIVCGLIGDTDRAADFKWAFLASGIGMVISVIIQRLFHNKYVKGPDDQILGLTPEGTQKKIINPVFIIVGLALLSIVTIGLLYIDAKVVNYLEYLLIGAVLFIAFIIFGDKKLSYLEKQRIGVIFIVSFFVVFFWTAFEQAGASLTFFCRGTNTTGSRFLSCNCLMAVWFLANSAANKLAGVLSALYPDNKTTSFLGYQMTNMHEFFMLFVVMSGVERSSNTTLDCF